MAKDNGKVYRHQDGTVSYFSIYEQGWRHHVSVVPDREFAAMPDSQRTALQAHLKHNQWRWQEEAL